MNEETDLKGHHTFILFLLCLYLADPATFLDFIIFPLRTACLFRYGKTNMSEFVLSTQRHWKYLDISLNF